MGTRTPSAASSASEAEVAQQQSPPLALTPEEEAAWPDAQPALGQLLGRSGTWRLWLRARSFSFQPAGAKRSHGDEQSVDVEFDDVSGVEFIGDGGPWNQYFCVCTYVREAKGKASRRRRVHIFRLLCRSDTAAKCQLKVASSRAVLRHSPAWQKVSVRRPLLVLANPASGSGSANRVFSLRVAPLLREAGRPYRLQLTQHSGHARQLLAGDSSLAAYSGVAVVSGDGLLHEALNGIGERSDWRQIFAKLPLAVLPAGSGNGIAASLAFDAGECLGDGLLLASAFGLVKGDARSVDLMLVEGEAVGSRLACLSVTHGLVTDIDLDSECLRCLGGARFTVTALLKLAAPRMRRYRARLSLLTPEAAREATTAHNGDSARRPRDLCRHLPPSVASPLPAAWETLEVDDFCLLVISLQSHLATDSWFSPGCRPDDGLLQVTWLPAGVSRSELLRALTEMETGGHVQRCSSFGCRRAVAFRLEPLGGEQRVCVDGELVPDGAVQGEVLPGLASFVALPPAGVTQL